MKGPAAATRIARLSGGAPLEPALDPAQRRFLRHQVLISIAINAFIPPAIIRALGLPPPLTLIDDRAVLPGMILASGLATLLMTVGLTLVVRMDARRAGRVAVPLATIGSLGKRLPANLLARSVVMGFLAIGVLVPGGVVALLALGLLPLGPRGFIVWNVLYGVAVGLLMAPLVVRRAMADGRVRR